MNDLEILQRATEEMREKQHKEAMTVTDKIIDAVGADPKAIREEVGKYNQAMKDRKRNPLIIQNPNPRALKLRNMTHPTESYVKFPKAVAEFVQKTTTQEVQQEAGRFHTVPEYFKRHGELKALLGTLPCTVPVPYGWQVEYVQGEHVDLSTLLEQGISANGTTAQDKLTELIQWACSQIKAMDWDTAQGNLLRLEKAGTERDEKVQEDVLKPLLTKIVMLTGMMQLPQFSGKPEKLVQTLESEWADIENDFTYKTCLSLLSRMPAYNQREYSTCTPFTSTGSLAECMGKFKDSLITDAKAVLRVYGPDSNDFNPNSQMKHLKLTVQRTEASADSEIVLVLAGTQESGHGEIHDGMTVQSSEDRFEFARITLGKDGLSVQELGGFGFHYADAVKGAVKVLAQLQN